MVGSLSDLGETGLAGDDHELGAVAGAQLGHRSVEMSLGVERADEQLGGDLVVRESLGGQSHGIALPIGQAVEADGRIWQPGVALRGGRRRVRSGTGVVF